MPTGDAELRLAVALTAGGATIFAGFITVFIEVLKRTFKVIGARGWEPALAFLCSAIVVVLAFVDQNMYTLNAGFLAFVAWLGIAKLAGVIYDTASDIVASAKATG